MLRYAVLFLLAVILGGWTHGNATGGNTGGAFVQLKIGAGGFVTNHQFANDGTVFARTDTAGAFVCQPNQGQCVPVVTQASMPSSNGLNVLGSLQGVCAIGIAPTNSQHLYMYYTPIGSTTAYFLTSTNQGKNWTLLTGFPTSSSVNCLPNDQQVPNYRTKSSYMGVSPANENVAYLGTSGDGVWFTTDGTSVSQISTSTIPAGQQPSGADTPQGNRVAFDLSDATGNTVFIDSYGTGVWKCTSAITSPSCTELNSSGMPTTQYALKADSSGTLWVMDGTALNILRYKSGAWSTVLAVSGGSGLSLSGIAINPANTNDVYVPEFHGCLYYTTTGQGTPSFTAPGGSCGVIPPTSFSVASSAIGWIPWANDSALSIGSINFDPSQSNVMEVGTGIGLATTSPGTTGNLIPTWNFNASQGIENLDLTAGIPLPGGGLGFSAQDRPLWFITNFAAYPSQYYPYHTGITGGFIQWGTGLCSQGNVYADTQLTGSSVLNISTTGSTGTYSNIPPTQSGLPANFGGGGATCVIYDANHFMIFGATTVTGNVPYYTADGGSTFSPCTFGGTYTADGGGWIGVAQDTTNPANVVMTNDGAGTNGSGAIGYYQATSFGGASCVFARVNATLADAFAYYFQPVQGKANAFTIGSYATGDIYLTQNSGATYGAAISGISGMKNWTSVGAPNPAKDGYTLYFSGTSSAVFGVYQVDNFDSTPVITNIDSADSGFPCKSLDYPILVGDSQTYGTLYVLYEQSGGCRRTLN